MWLWLGRDDEPRRRRSRDRKLKAVVHSRAKRPHSLEQRFSTSTEKERGQTGTTQPRGKERASKTRRTEQLILGADVHKLKTLRAPLSSAVLLYSGNKINVTAGLRMQGGVLWRQRWLPSMDFHLPHRHQPARAASENSLLPSNNSSLAWVTL